MVEDPKGPNAIITRFKQLIKHTESLHVLKLHESLIAKLPQIVINAKLSQLY